MEKDERYLAVRTLIETGKITKFDQCFKYIPKTKVAIDLKAHQGRFSALINNVQKFTVSDIFHLSELLEVDNLKIYMLMANQFVAEQTAKQEQNKKH